MDSVNPMDPMRWWLAWLQSAARGPSAAAGAPGASAPNPFASLFANPFASALPAPFDLWRRWLETLPLLALGPFAFGSGSGSGSGPESRSRSGAGTAGGNPFDLAARWREMLGASAAAGQAPGANPFDPWQQFHQWFEAASAAWSPPLEDLLRSEPFAQAAGAFVESASMARRALRRTSEAQLAALAMPSRDDVARVASLVVQVEAKVDRLEEALEDAEDRRGAEQAARDNHLVALERRVERIEDRLDRLLALVEGLDERQRRATAAAAEPPASAANAAPPSASTSTGATRTHKPSTTRTRRKPASAT